MPEPEIRPVIYVEDDENDSLMLTRALYKIHSPLPLQVIRDGQSAWEFLTGQGASPRPPVPSLLLLDLKLPRKSGLELLSSLKAHETLKRVPVVVMTSSTRVDDIERAYSLGADFYLAKRADFVATLELAKALDAYWKALTQDPDAIGSDPTFHLLRKLSEPPPVRASK
jgi:CheY-like chemotaxis protein